MDGQKRLEDYCKSSVRDDVARQQGTVNSMLAPDYHSCSFEEGSVTLTFKVQKWETNRIGILHGGITAAAFDYAMGMLARFYADQNFTPTVSMEIKYIRPVELGETLLVKARVVSVGKKIIHLTVEGRSQESDKLTATGAGIFYQNDKRS